MNVKSCRKCKALFKSTENLSICPVCLKKIDENFIQVREYIYQNPNATMDQICENTGVERSDIVTWLKQGKLVMEDTAIPLITCETCGKAIVSGRYCPACNAKVKSQLKFTAQTMTAQKDEKKKSSEIGKPKRGTHLDLDSYRR